MFKQDGERYNDLANAAFEQKQFSDALRYYKQAIACESGNAIYYCNRSACHLKFQCYNDALEDAISASNIDPNYPRAYHQMVECYLAHGNYSQARRSLKKLEELNPRFEPLADLLSRTDKLEREEEEAIKLLEKNEYQSALALAKLIIERSPANNRALSIQVECLLRLKSIDEAEEIYYEYLCSEEHLSEIKYLRALINYYRNEMDTALDLCKMITNEDPDFSKAVKLYKTIKQYKDILSAGSRAFQAGDFSGADKLYSHGLDIDPTNELALVKLYVNKTLTSIRMKSHMDAIAYSSKALAIDPNNLKAYHNRAQAYITAGDKPSAIADFMKAYELNKDEGILKRLEELQKAGDEKQHHKETGETPQYDIQDFLNKYKNEEKKDSQHSQANENKSGNEEAIKIKTTLAEFKATLSQMQRMKPHEILQVQMDANENDIRKAYSKCVKKYHPDHYAKHPPLKEICEEIFKLIQNARRAMQERRK